MVKVKTPGRDAFRTPPITKFFPPAQNSNNKGSEISTPDSVSNKHGNENLSYTPSKKIIRKDYETTKRNKSGCSTPGILKATPESSHKNQEKNNVKIPILIASDDDDSKSIPDVIEDDEDDDLLSKTDFICIPTEEEKNISIKKEESSENNENNLRRSSRSRRVFFQEGFVPTVDVIPMKGDIPMLDAPSTSAKESNTFKPSYQNSLSALLREKKIRDKAGYNINALEQALENDMLDEMEDPFDSYNRLEISASILDKDVKFEQMRQILEEDDKFDQNHQIEFFRNLNSNPQIPNLQPVANNNPTFDLLLKVSSDREKLKYILCNNWIAHQYKIGWQLSTEIIVWLLHLVSYEEDKIISEGSFNTLKNIAEIKGSLGSSLKNETEDINIPFLEVYKILTALGASKEIISSQYCLEQNIEQISLFEVPSSFNYINNVKQLLKTLVPLIDNRIFKFSSSEEIRSAIIILLRLPLDKRLLSLSSDVEQVLDSLLAMFQEDQWVEQAKLICDDVEFSCGSVVQFKVTILENLPISNRGYLLRRFFAFRFLFGSESPLSQHMNILNVSEPEIFKSILNLFQNNLAIFKIRDETNYNDLYNYVLLLDYALDDELQLRKAKDTVEEIISKLKHLNGKIVDMRAAFMERTRAKDLIQRLYMRLYYISSHRRGKTQASILFYSPKKKQKTLQDMDVDKETDGFQII